MVKPKSNPRNNPKPPPTEVFEKNKLYEFHRGFAFKVDAKTAKERYGLEPGKEKIVWLSPDGKSILSDSRAVLNNARRRSSLNLADSWNDFKSVDPERAKELGWNNFQKLMKGTKGSRVTILQKFDQIGLSFDSIGELAVAADGEFGDNNGWGDSG